MLAKTAGVKHLVILVNKMDDPTVEWDKLRLVFKVFSISYNCSSFLVKFNLIKLFCCTCNMQRSLIRLDSLTISGTV